MEFSKFHSPCACQELRVPYYTQSTYLYQMHSVVWIKRDAGPDAMTNSELHTYTFVVVDAVYVCFTLHKKGESYARLPLFLNSNSSYSAS